MKTFEGYFSELETHLKCLSLEERTDVLTYYKEYAQDGGFLDGEQLAAHFGSPRSLASQILAESAVKRVDNGKNGFGTAAIALAAIFSLPVTIPVALAAACVLFVLFLMLLAILGIFGIGLWFFGCASMGIFSGISASVSPAVWMKLLGVILLTGSALIAAFWGIIRLARLLLKKLMVLVSKISGRENSHA